MWAGCIPLRKKDGFDRSPVQRPFGRDGVRCGLVVAAQGREALGQVCYISKSGNLMPKEWVHCAGGFVRRWQARMRAHPMRPLRLTVFGCGCLTCSAFGRSLICLRRDTVSSLGGVKGGDFKVAEIKFDDPPGCSRIVVLSYGVGRRNNPFPGIAVVRRNFKRVDIEFDCSLARGGAHYGCRGLRIRQVRTRSRGGWLRSGIRQG